MRTILILARDKKDYQNTVDEYRSMANSSRFVFGNSVDDMDELTPDLVIKTERFWHREDADKLSDVADKVIRRKK